MNAPHPTPDDDWARIVERLARTHGRTPRGNGRVLSVKFGYNPNSSSVGSVITILLWTGVFAASALNIMNALLHARHQRLLTDASPPSPAEGANGQAPDEP